MNPTRTTTPTEPVTLAEAKLHLRVDGTDEDALIWLYIKAARESCEDRLECTLPVTSWRLTLDSFPEAIRLLRGPMLTLDAVRYIDIDGVQQTLSPQDYRLDMASTPGYVVPSFGKAWPETRAEINAVEVDFTAGYSIEIPAATKAWILLAIGELYANREASSDRPVVAHGFADRLLDPFRYWGA